MAARPLAAEDWAVMQATPVAGVEMLRAHFVEHAFERHSHEQWSLGITLAGKQTFRCRGSTVTSLPGDLIVFRPDEAHDGHAEDSSGFKYAMLYLPEGLVSTWLAQSGRSRRGPAFGHALIHDPVCAKAVALAVGALGEKCESLRSESLLCQSVLDVFARHGRHEPELVVERSSAKWLGEVKEYLEAHYADNISVDELARVAGVSRVHLTRAFVQVCGISPHVHLNALRLRAAKNLLIQRVPIADVAYQVGFSDQSHLTRRFKGSVGLTPAAWIEQMSR